MKPSEKIHDELLVLRCREGDAGALDELLGRWQERLWRHARRLTDDDDAAWDALQEACLAIGHGIGRLEDEAAFPAWAYRIVSNKCRDWLRRKCRRRKGEEFYAAELLRQSEATENTQERITDLKEALGRLAGPDRAILALHYEDNLDIVQIAAILGIPEGTVKSRLYYARQRLRMLMEDTNHD